MDKPAAHGPPRFTPLWRHRAAPFPRLSPFAPDVRYDCAVVGAGITGCSTALHLAGLGARVCVLEADTPGAGTSGYANGQVMAELARSPDSIVRLYGATRGDQILRATDAAPGLVFDLIGRHGIDCDAERTGWIEGSPWHFSERGFRRRVASWQARGAPVEFLDGAAMAKHLGSSTYVAGILDRRGGLVNPLAYTRGLAVAALEAGASIQGPVRVFGLVARASDWQVVTDRGCVTATFVVAATNAYTGRLLPGLRHPVVCLYGVQSATVPLPASLRHLLAGRPGFSDVRKRFFRWSVDGRLIVGGPGGLWRPSSGRGLAFRWLERSLRQVFPELRDVPFEHRWYARGAASADLLPRLYEPAPRLFAAIGYAGRGIAIGTALGQAMAERIAGRAPGALSFPIASHALPWGLAGFRPR